MQHAATIDAYADPEAPTRSPRGIEYEAIARITARLRAATEVVRGKDDTGGFARLATALHDNRRLWTALAADVADPGNGLPQELRARIFWLAEFTGRHSGRVIAEGADPAPLIEINTAILRGLRGEAGSP